MRRHAESRRRPRGAARGFTLLEVLVALAIIAVALAAALRGAMSLTTNAEDMRMKLLATLEAENRLLELRLARAQLGIGDSRSDCEQGGVVFACEQQVKPTPNPFFRRVIVRVTRSDSDRTLAELLSVLPTN